MTNVQRSRSRCALKEVEAYELLSRGGPWPGDESENDFGSAFVPIPARHATDPRYARMVWAHALKGVRFRMNL
jgi:hypothetical protein